LLGCDGAGREDLPFQQPREDGSSLYRGRVWPVGCRWSPDDTHTTWTEPQEPKTAPTPGPLSTRGYHTLGRRSSLAIRNTGPVLARGLGFDAPRKTWTAPSSRRWDMGCGAAGECRSQRVDGLPDPISLFISSFICAQAMPRGPRWGLVGCGRGGLHGEMWGVGERFLGNLGYYPTFMHVPHCPVWGCWGVRGLSGRPDPLSFATTTASLWGTLAMPIHG
jgi:hypothetical protein